MTNHPFLLQCFDTVGWVTHQTCKNRRPYNLHCVGADVKPCSINETNILKYEVTRDVLNYVIVVFVDSSCHL